MRSKKMSSYGSWLLLLSSIFALGAVGNPALELDFVPKLEKKADGSTKAGICNYLGFQSIFMQDRVYVDGGQLNYIVNGTAGTQQTTVPEYPTNLSYIDLNKPFDFSKQLPEEKLNFFTPVESAQGRPAILFGALLGDDYSWLQYGGMRGGAPTDGSGRSEGQSERFDFKQDPENPTTSWAGDTRFGAPLTLPKDKDDTVTNWVYAGAVARSPGDKKSWWFSGSRGKNWGEVIFLRRTENQSVAGLSNYLITADFSFQQVPKLTNSSIDSSVAPRAGASMVFLPVGEKGILAVLGGVSVPDPVWMVGFGARDKYSADDLKDQAAASRKFLQTIDIYDIASGDWYSQNTTGQIPTQPISAACAVAASADDRSSHNIYFYGGHGGLSYTEGDPGSETNDKFYVLTLPSFRWIEVLDPASGEATGRSLHQCHRVQPDQMLIIGGHPTANSPINKGNTNCALWPGPGPAMVFDLNTCQVQTDGWDPRKKADYKVPDKVIAVIGGSGTGGASKKAPENGWSDDGLKKLFSNPTAYTARDTPIWAYTPTDTNTAPEPTDTNSSSSSDSGGSSFPSYIPPLLGTLLGLFGLITILSIILFVLRRRKQRRAADAAPSETEGSTVRKNKQTWSWLLGVYGDEKSSRGAHQPLGHMRNYSDDFSHGTGMYGASSGLGSEANRESVMSPISPITEGSDPVMELQGKVIHEMPDTSVPQELAGGYYPKEKHDSRPKEGKTVRYDDQEQTPAPGDEIQTQGTSHSLGHRKMSSLDYPE